MPEWSTIGLFLTAAFILIVTPGPAVLYIVARSVHQGRQAGLVSVLGIGVGSLFHVVAATLGLSALLMSSALAFTVVKYAGAVYLIYLGVRTLLNPDDHGQTHTLPQQRLSRIFVQGLFVNLLNPKIALFFFAFLPQFVDPTRGPVMWQILFFGCLLTAIGIISDSVYALLAGTVGNWLRSNLRLLQAQRFFTGGVYITLGLATALSGSEKK